MSIYDFEVRTVEGNKISLGEFKGKVLLIVNSATQCGFTPQYDKLQDMYEKYAKEGFVILDFPCNQFGNQAPGSDEEIVSFCDARFGITFPQFSKIDVNGENAIPLYQYLVKEKGFQGFDPEEEMTSVLNGVIRKTNPNYANEPDIKWNFTKFLVDRDGNVVERFEPMEHMDVVEDKMRELL
ncbi:glutathione peroxidase [Lachnoclostridium phytofermentans]|uniref:Glutathione peroxidase n=1 Tax=Lachnoclostridium phytofermentans (strain ATCC 700394 / DSM 18823 / ISDg) TaxID=357809 RepID=A9KN12_LACP7|nr:glutathione peroxidase [Lachnoclostridium phytofermentans]ABX43023.1 Glutathione peroxidase [Lachnoclostridium phytofermentans ISDg]